MRNKFRFVKQIVRKRNPLNSRLNKIRLEKNERVSKFERHFLNKIKRNLKSEHISAYPEVEKLYQKIAKKIKVKKEMIVITAGSDLAIKNCFELFISPKDQLVTINPTYGMVDVYAKLFRARQIKINYDKNLNINVDDICMKIKKKTKLVIIANPNSPTGTVMHEKDIKKILNQAKRNNSYVLIDECYYGYYKKTFIRFLKKYNNLIISRSFSKIGLAGCRIGYLVASKEIAELLYKYRPFYEITSFSSYVLDEVLSSNSIIQKYIKETLAGKNFLMKKLNSLKIKYFNTNTNFILIKFRSKIIRDKIQKFLVSKNFLVLGESKLIEGEKILRITLGPKKYMKMLFEKIHYFLKANNYKFNSY